MARIKSEDILKPGAVMEVKLIDWETPENKRLLENLKKRQAKLKSMRGWRYEGWWRKL